MATLSRRTFPGGEKIKEFELRATTARCEMSWFNFIPFGSSLSCCCSRQRKTKAESSSQFFSISLEKANTRDRTKPKFQVPDTQRRSSTANSEKESSSKESLLCSLCSKCIECPRYSTQKKEEQWNTERDGETERGKHWKLIPLFGFPFPVQLLDKDMKLNPSHAILHWVSGMLHMMPSNMK